MFKVLETLDPRIPSKHRALCFFTEDLTESENIDLITEILRRRCFVAATEIVKSASANSKIVKFTKDRYEKILNNWVKKRINHQLNLQNQHPFP